MPVTTLGAHGSTHLHPRWLPARTADGTTCNAARDAVDSQPETGERVAGDT
ncbi:hypothetical protein [Rhodococcus jostii]|uniref:hypothetical protein n=1 Tax=Rhodococcus jostii TaxID=132919 RepID=UPI0013C2FD05|nr:hypothetical protein [Rhodococcus jostii]